MPKRIAFKKTTKRLKTYIREWREYRDLSQEALADLIGTSGSMISRIEKGETPYTQDTIEAMATALRTDIPSLLTRDPNDGDGIWSIWQGAKEADQRKIIDIAKTILGKTGTGG